MKGCMNCGNISCGNNKKRESAGCGRWKAPEQKILELEEKVGMAERTRDRLISIGFPTFASCKEYAAKLKGLEKENAELKEKTNILDNCDRLGDVITEAYKDQLTKAKELLKQWLQTSKASSCDNVNIVTDTEQFLSEVENV